MIHWKRNDGSITVSLTVVFVLLLALVLVVIENTRVLTAGGYVSTAADAAVESVFGDYNKELYDTYHLFGYGGYGGMNATDLTQRLTASIQKNLSARPEEGEGMYSDLYRISKISCPEVCARSIAVSEILRAQIFGYLKVAAVEDITDSLLKKYRGESQDDVKDMGDDLAKVGDFENGKYDSYFGDENDEADEEQIQQGKKEIEDELQKDPAKGNPLEALKEIVTDGFLSLVCDTSVLSECSVRKREQSDHSEKQEDAKDASGYLNGLLEQGQQDALAKLSGLAVDKAGEITYAQKVFPCYGEETDKAFSYGLEYLAVGHQSEKENLSGIVARLLAVRMVCNFCYVNQNPAFVEKSLATATILAGFTGLTPLIQAIQKTILLILAFEEACVDVSALLLGKKVPLVKSAESFSVKYEEICLGSGQFFQDKAKKLPESRSGAISVGYQQMLLLFLMLVPTDTLELRMLDLIEFDLQERYNQTFQLSTCYAGAEVTVSYQIPAMFGNVLELFQRDLSYGELLREETVSYAYTK